MGHFMAKAWSTVGTKAGAGPGADLMLGGDPVCLHRAAYWYAQGVLELDPEPPASAALVVCFRCHRAEVGCPVCQGAGIVPLSVQAEALRAAG